VIGASFLCPVWSGIPLALTMRWSSIRRSALQTVTVLQGVSPLALSGLAGPRLAIGNGVLLGLPRASITFAAYVQGMGTLNGVGQHQFVATVVDNHYQSRADRFGLRVIDGNFVTVNHCTFGPVDLTSGQTRIVHG
jgi:hypothetical protein